jgi:hypothetical protein
MRFGGSIVGGFMNDRDDSEDVWVAVRLLAGLSRFVV